jgi:hypothetical protein
MDVKQRESNEAEEQPQMDADFAKRRMGAPAYRRVSQQTNLDRDDGLKAEEQRPPRPVGRVLVVETDAASGLSQIRMGGIVSDLWTHTKKPE